MMKHWQWGLVASGVLGATGALFATWVSGPEGAPAGSATFETDWPVGRTAVYGIEWKSTALAEQLDPKTHAPSPQVVSDFKIAGELQLTRIPGPRSQVLLYADLIHPSLDIRLQEGRTTGHRAEATKELDEPFLIELNRDGLVERVRIPQNIGTTGFAAFKSIAALIQRSNRETARESWVAVEADLSGRAELTYSLTGRTLKKEKLRYLSLVQGVGIGAQSSQDAQVTITESRHIHQLGKSWFSPAEEISVDESTQIELGGAFAPMTSRVHLQLSLKSVSDSGQESLPSFLPDKFQATRLDQLPSEEIQLREREQRSVDGRSVAELTESIVELEQQKPRDRKTEARIFSALKSKMRLDAGAREEAERSIRADENRMLLLDALGSAGTPETQALLVKLISELNLGREQTRSSLINLSMSENPTDETIHALKERTDDPSHGMQATFGLGSAAFHLRNTRPQEATALVQDLVKRLESTSDETQKATLLKALGNTGNNLSLPSCEEYIKAASLHLRSAAADCARLIDGPRADMILATAVRDQENTVAKTAINAALQRTYSSLLAEPLTEIVLSDRAKHLRITATQVLVGWMKDQPSLIATVRQVANNDPDDELRAYARRMLSKLS